MTLGLIGTKIGMTRVFTEGGSSIPVTVVEVKPNVVTQVKTDESDGYNAVQVTTGSIADKKLTAPARGVFAKAEVEPGNGLWEFRLDSQAVSQISTGTSFGVDMFEPGQKVDVKGVSIGRGFAGVMKRHNFGGGRATHGNSKAHRKPGSIGQNQTPSRVFPGKKMAGHMGCDTKVQQNLEVVSVDEDRSLLLIKGAVPGSRQSIIVVTSAVKAKAPAAVE
ncbi:MAG: 50S ribosomal protein L3 [Acidiferrobacterales bacterium]|nr:50S ribosomal protein L3 [Acidiferrobacterales bacterium]